MESIRRAILKSTIIPAVSGLFFVLIAVTFVLHEIESEYVASRKEITVSTASLIYNNIQIFYTPPYVKHLIYDATKDIKDREVVFFYYKGRLFGNKGAERFFDLCKNLSKAGVFKVREGLLVCYPVYTEMASSLLAQENRQVDAIFGIVFNRKGFLELRNHLVGGIVTLSILTGSLIAFLLAKFYRMLLSDISKFSEIIEILKANNLRLTQSFKFSFKEFLSVYRLIKQLVERIKKLVTELEREATVDRLTSLYNRNFLERVAGRLVALHERTRKPMSVAMLDIDDFKVINDTYGHRRGDAVLKKIGEIIRESVRRSDLPFRYGGEEFLLLFPETQKLQAANVCERLRKRISEADFGFDKKITVSIGVASMPEDTKTYIDIEKLINLSDERLYKAKKLGKNRVVYEG